MAATVPVAVIIPTYRRGTRILLTLEKISECDPGPTEIWIHVDQSDGALESLVAERFPSAKILSSPIRLGPGGGRHRCLEQCVSPYAVSFDDDSYPLDSDFFERVLTTFESHVEVAVIGASICYRNEVPRERNVALVRRSSFTACGCAIRLSAYRQTRGFVPRQVAYGLEETDISLLLFTRKWRICESAELRVCHDTELVHHQHPEITEGVVANVALFAFFHYPASLWGWGLLQLGKVVWFCLKMGRCKGIVSGLERIPRDFWHYRRYRRPLAWKVVWEFLKLRRTETSW